MHTLRCFACGFAMALRVRHYRNTANTQRGCKNGRCDEISISVDTIMRKAQRNGLYRLRCVRCLR